MAGQPGFAAGRNRNAGPRRGGSPGGGREADWLKALKESNPIDDSIAPSEVREIVKNLNEVLKDDTVKENQKQGSGIYQGVAQAVRLFQNVVQAKTEPARLREFDQNNPHLPSGDDVSLLGPGRISAALRAAAQAASSIPQVTDIAQYDTQGMSNRARDTLRQDVLDSIRTGATAAERDVRSAITDILNEQRQTYGAMSPGEVGTLLQPTARRLSGGSVIPQREDLDNGIERWSLEFKTAGGATIKINLGEFDTQLVRPEDARELVARSIKDLHDKMSRDPLLLVDKGERFLTSSIAADLVRGGAAVQALDGVEIQDRSLIGLHFTGTKFSNCQFKSVAMIGADFSGAEFRNVSFRKCDLRGAQFIQTEWHDKCSLKGSDVSRGSFFGSRIRDTGMQKVIASETDLRGMTSDGIEDFLGNTKSTTNETVALFQTIAPLFTKGRLNLRRSAFNKQFQGFQIGGAAFDQRNGLPFEVPTKGAGTAVFEPSPTGKEMHRLARSSPYLQTRGPVEDQVAVSGKPDCQYIDVEANGVRAKVATTSLHGQEQFGRFWGTDHPEPSIGDPAEGTVPVLMKLAQMAKIKLGANNTIDDQNPYGKGILGPTAGARVITGS